MDSFSDYIALARAMVEDDGPRQTLISAVDDIYHMNNTMPPELEPLEWLRWTSSPVGHNAIQNGAHIFASVMPDVQVDPDTASNLTQKRIETIESWLGVQLRSAFRRRNSSAQTDIVRSALMYDEVILSVQDMEYLMEKDGEGTSARDKRRMSRLRKYGRFQVKPLHPANVITRYSDYGLEATLTRSADKIQNVVDRWGKKNTRQLQRSMATTQKYEGMEYVTVWDYMDDEVRCVWAIPQAHRTPSGVSTGIKIILKERQETFLPYAAAVGGTMLSNKDQVQRVPMLYSMVQTGLYDDLSLVESFVTSMAIARTAAPSFFIKGPGAKNIRFSYFDPVKHIVSDNLLDEIQDIPVPQPDPALSQILAQMNVKADEGGLPRVVFGGNVPEGAAYASINTVTQSALKRLLPGRRIAERAIEEVCYALLNWMVFTKTDIVLRGASARDTDVVKFDEIPLETLLLKVKLHEDSPADSQARMNNATTALASGLVTQNLAREMAGLPNASNMQENIEREAVHNSIFQGEQQKLAQAVQMELSLREQGLGMLIGMAQDPMFLQLLQGMNQAIQEQMQAAEVAPQGGDQGDGQIPDQRFNPAAGGQTDNVRDPGGNTRESSTGVDRQGNDVGVG